MPNYFKTSDFFKYEMKQKSSEEDKRNTLPGPVHYDNQQGEQALIDWFRNRNVYFINGISVKRILLDLAKSDNDVFLKIAIPKYDDQHNIVDIEEFNGIEGLKEFFNKYLLCNIKDAKVRDQMCGLALNHFIQSGLPHAANYTMQGRIGDPNRESSNILLTEPNFSVNFIPLADGIKMTEKNVCSVVKGLNYKFNLLFIPEDAFNKMKKSKKGESMFVEMKDGSYSLWGLSNKNEWKLTQIDKEVADSLNIPKLENKETRMGFSLERNHQMVDVLKEYHAPFAEADFFQEIEDKSERKNEGTTKGRFGRLWGKEQKDYFVKVECTTSLTVNKKDLQEKVTLHDITLDVPDPRFHSMFNKITFIEWLKERLVSIMKRNEFRAPVEVKSPR